jgi:hypothetical protein
VPGQKALKRPKIATTTPILLPDDYQNWAACHTPTHQNNQENPFYYPENSDKLIFIDKRGLNQ